MPEKLNEYNERFGEGFPMIPLGWGRTDEQIMAIIDECLEKGKDVYELGYVTDDEEVNY
jgi:hypothetical protein